jgi:mannosyl-oligosaccharide glucosidase
MAQRIKSAIDEHLFDASDFIYKDLLIGTSAENKDTVKFSPHIGYPNLFPIAFGFIDVNDTPILDAYLKLIESPNLWSEYGIRSLSLDDNFFGMVIISYIVGR